MATGWRFVTPSDSPPSEWLGAWSVDALHQFRVCRNFVIDRCY
jgi:hypothetical protein